MPQAEYISCTDTAKLVRKALKQAFPGNKFSVRSSFSCGGASIYVTWVDGPAFPDVKRVIRQFEGATFDGMTDSRSYVEREFEGQTVQFGADYVLPTRKMSRKFVEAIIQQFCAQFGRPPFDIVGDDQDARPRICPWDASMDHWLNILLNETSVENMYRAHAAQEDRRQAEHDEYLRNEPFRRQQEQEETKHEQERREREDRIKQEKREREGRTHDRHQQTNGFSETQHRILSSRGKARDYLNVSWLASHDEVIQAYRKAVKGAADGKGGYTQDMDFLKKVKEMALS